MSIIYRQIEVVVAVQTTAYGTNRAIHAEASFPSPDPTREWQIDYVSLQILPGTIATNFAVMFYRGTTGLAINASALSSTVVDLGGLRTDGQVRLLSTDNITSATSGTRIISVTPPRRVSISLDNGVYKFQTFTSGAITPTDAAAKFVIGLVSGG